MKKILFISMLVLSISCQSRNVNNDVSKDTLKQVEFNEGKSIDELITERPTDSKDIFEINNNCAVLLQLTDAESDSIENASGEDYGEYADDTNNSTMSAYETLEKFGIDTKTINNRYICFVNHSNSQTVYLDTRKTDDYKSGCFILFSKSRQPRIIGSDLLNEELIKKYFNK